MRKSIIALCAALMMLLTACGNAGTTASQTTAASQSPETTAAETTAAGTAAEQTTAVDSIPETTAEITTAAETTLPQTTQATATTAFVSETNAQGWHTVLINGTVFWIDGTTVVEPESTLNIADMDFSDFGDTFSESYPVTVDSYQLMTGTACATTVTHIKAAESGPVVYIVAGTHGDEKAGWYAGTLLKEATLACGELYVLSVANVQGAQNNTRCVTGSQDLNRSYPGGTKNQASQLAAAIYGDIQSKQPEFVLDLHEAIRVSETADFLGSSLIFTDLDCQPGFDELFWELFFAIDGGELCEESFTYTGPAPNGSLNKTVTEELKIPVITVETFRGYEIEHRVEEQLEIVEYVLNYKGMR